MDFFSAISIVWKRWYVTLLCLVVTAIVALLVMRSVAPSYSAHGSAMLTAPSSVGADATDNPAAQNPFVRFDFSTGVFTSVVVQIMNDVEVRESLESRGISSEYEIGTSGDNTPVVNVRLVDADPALALATVQHVLVAVNEILDQRQAEAGAPPEARVRAIVITSPSRASELLGGRIRAGLGTAVLGVAGSVSLAFLVEAWAQRRAQRRVGVGVGLPEPAVVAVGGDGSGADGAAAAEAAEEDGDDLHDLPPRWAF